MTTSSVSVEWLFKEIIGYFALMDFKKTKKKKKSRNRRYNLVLLEKCTLLVRFGHMHILVYINYERQQLSEVAIRTCSEKQLFPKPYKVRKNDSKCVRENL